MTDTVYVIEKGCYSDRHIVAVTADRQRADNLARLFSDDYDSCSVEEYELDEAKTESALYTVRFMEDGTIAVNRGEYEWHEHGDVADYPLDDSVMRVWVRASDEEHAKKAAQDRRAAYLAQKAGV